MTKDELLRNILEDLNEKYLPGLYEFLFKNRTELYKQLQSIENNIDNAYLDGTVEELKLALRDYWVFHVRVIQLFKISNKSDTNVDLTETRKEMLEGRLNG